MAIINLTPDSFWHESRRTADDVLFAVEKALNDGAEVIDLGRAVHPPELYRGERGRRDFKARTPANARKGAV